MRLFLYLVALVAGFSPAEAGRVAMAEPVAVGRVSQSAEVRLATPASKPLAHAAFLTSHGRLPLAEDSSVAGSFQMLRIARIALTDRLRA